MSSMASSRLLRFAAGAAGALPIVIAINDCCVSLVMCQGVSMQPTINPYPDQKALGKYYFARFGFKDIVLLDKFSPRQGNFKKGSVVMFKSVQDPTRMIMKRLVALEGDWVINKVSFQKGNYVHIPQGHGWVEGDNTDDSIDSNTFGAIPLGVIVGRASHVCWPPWRASRIPIMNAQDATLSRRRKVRRRPFQIDKYEDDTTEQEVTIAAEKKQDSATKIEQGGINGKGTQPSPNNSSEAANNDKQPSEKGQGTNEKEMTAHDEGDLSVAESKLLLAQFEEEYQLELERHRAHGVRVDADSSEETSREASELDVVK